MDGYLTSGTNMDAIFFKILNFGQKYVLYFEIQFSRTDPSNWRDAKVIGNFVYIVSEAWDHGMQVKC